LLEGGCCVVWVGRASVLLPSATQLTVGLVKPVPRLLRASSVGVTYKNSRVYTKATEMVRRDDAGATAHRVKLWAIVWVCSVTLPGCSVVL
jgi:hypothetical protein